MDLVNNVTYDYASLDEAFPKCDPGIVPFGSRVLVQIRSPKKKTAGGIMLVTGGDTQATEFWTQQVAKVIAVGPVAFCDRKSLAPWPEGAWCKVGDFVRVPRYGGDRWTVTIDDETEALIIVFNDLDIIGKVTSDPTKIKAYI